MAEGGDLSEDLHGDLEASGGDNVLEVSGSNDNALEQEYIYRRNFCKSCEKRAKKIMAVNFCRECSQYLCMDCSVVHTYFDSLKGHSLVEAHKVDKSDGMINLKGYDVCKDHNKPMEFYCEDCYTIACCTCAVVGHRRCKSVLEIRTIAVNLKTSNSTLRATTSRLKDKAQLAVDHWEQADHAFHESVQQLSQKINEARTAVNSAFDRLLKSAETGSGSIMKTANVSTKQNLDRCNQLVDTIDEYVKVIDNVSQFGTPEQIFIVNNQIQNCIQATLEVAVKDLSKLKTIELEFRIKKKATIGSLVDEQNLPGYVRLLTNCLNVRPFEDEVPMKLKYTNSVEVTQERNETKEPLFTGMDFLTDGRLIAVDNKNDKLTVFSRDLKKLASNKLPAHPTGMTVIRDEVAIFFASVSFLELHFYFVDKMNSITFVRKFPLPEQFSSIYVKDENNFVMTTINGNKPVRIVSIVGQVSNFDLIFSDKVYGIDGSACAYIRNDVSEKLVLLHAEESFVSIYDIQTGVEVTVRDEMIVKPRSVAICPSGTILVATVDRIVQISPSGRILASFFADMANCRSICVSKEYKRLAVTNAVKLSKMIRLFKIENQFVEKV